MPSQSVVCPVSYTHLSASLRDSLLEETRHELVGIGTTEVYVHTAVSALESLDRKAYAYLVRVRLVVVLIL